MYTYMNVCILVYVVQLLAGIYAIHKDLAPFTCVHGLHASKQYLCYTYWLHTIDTIVQVHLQYLYAIYVHEEEVPLAIPTRHYLCYTYMLVDVARATNGERKSPRMISN